MFTYMLNRAKRELDHALKTTNGFLLFYRLNYFLYIVFSIREKFNVFDKEENYISGLKRFHNILKHDYAPNEILESITVKGEQEIIDPLFMPINNIKMPKKYDDENNLYNNYVKNKSIRLLITDIFNDTLNLLKNNNYI